MKELLTMLLMAPFLLVAQDFTIDRAGEIPSADPQGENTVIVIPFHSHFFISEVDRMLTPSQMDVMQMREKIRMKCTMEITKALGDSLDAIDISTGNTESDIDLPEYIYNALDYTYIALEEAGEDKRPFQFKLPTKSDKKVYGAFITTRDGQLDRTEIHTDRYMSASFGNPGAVAYLQDLWAFEYVLAITQLELKRNMENDSDKDYYIALHYEWMDNSGEQLKGGKIIEFLNASEMHYQGIMTEIIPSLAKDLTAEIWSELHLTNPKSPDFSDY